MSPKWGEFVDNLKDDAGKLAKAELKDLILTAQNDSEIFLREQGMKLERYLNQLALSQITKEQFEGYMHDINTTPNFSKESEHKCLFPVIPA